MTRFVAALAQIILEPRKKGRIMAKLPVEVTAKEWKSAKPLTLKDPGLDKKLADWEKVKTETETTPKIANFKKCGDALKAVVDMAKTAQAACNKTLHKDGIAFLGGYPAAIAKISQGLQKNGEDYSKRVAAWSKKRVDCLAGMKKLQGANAELTSKFEATKKVCESSKNTPMVGKSVNLAETFLKEINTFKEKAIEVMNLVRIDDPTVRINVDDRDQKFIDMFTESINIQSGFEGEFRTQIGYLEKFIKENKK